MRFHRSAEIKPIKRTFVTTLAFGALMAAQPAIADTLNLICQYAPYAGDSGGPAVDLVWVDAGAHKVYVSNSPSYPGRGDPIADALSRANGHLEEWPVEITATTIKWTGSVGTPRPVEINRLTGVLSWSTPQDPTPPSAGTAQCQKGTVPFPATKF